jgi:hypothetical protein
MNPFSALAEFVLGKMKQSAMALWMKLLFQIGASMLGSFLFACAAGIAAALAMKCGAAIALVAGIGHGFLWAALVLVYFIRRSPLTKGMMFVFPAEEAIKEIEANFQTIQK